MFNELKNELLNIELGYEVMIDPQYNDPVIDKLEKLIARARNVRATSKEGKKISEDIAKTISDRFNLPVKYMLGEGFACIPHIPYDNVLSDFNKEMLNNDMDSMTEEIMKIAESIYYNDIVVDLKNAKIYGIPKDMKTYIILDRTMFKDSNELNVFNVKSLTDREIVAVLLHEVGHLFTYMYHSSRMVKNNTMLLESFIYAHNKNIKDAEQILLEKTGIKKLTDKNKTIVFKQISDDIERDLTGFRGLARQLGLTSIFTNLEDAHGKVGTDSETEADNFAVRFGLGGDLASGLTKLMKPVTGVGAYMWTVALILTYSILIMLLMALLINPAFFGQLPFMFLQMLLFTLLFYVIFGTLSLVFELFGLDIVNFPYEKLYNRLEMMKREYIKIIRNYKLSKSEIEDTLKGIKAIEKQIKQLESTSVKMGLQNILANFNAGRVFDFRKLEYLLERRLQDNDLHYLAELLKSKND